MPSIAFSAKGRLSSHFTAVAALGALAIATGATGAFALAGCGGSSNGSSDGNGGSEATGDAAAAGTSSTGAGGSNPSDAAMSEGTGASNGSDGGTNGNPEADGGDGLGASDAGSGGTPAPCVALDGGVCLATLSVEDFGTTYPTAIAVDGTNVYWADSDGAVHKLPKTGGTSATIVPASTTTKLERVSSLAVDGANVYWSSGRQLSKVSANGGAITVLSTDEAFDGVAIDSTYIYWIETGGGASLMKTPLAGGDSVLLGAVAADQQRLAVAGGYVYVFDVNGDLQKVATADGTTTTLATGGGNEPFMPMILVAGSNVYWTASLGDNKVHVVSTSGGTPVAFGSSMISGPVAADGTNVFWADEDLATLSKMPLASAGAGTASLVLSGYEPTDMVDDGSTLFFVQDKVYALRSK